MSATLSGERRLRRARSELGTGSRREVWKRAASHGAFGAVPLLITAFILWIALTDNRFAVDFHSAFWPAGAFVLHGVTPYVGPNSFPATHGFAFVYPAPGALFFAALAWIPHGLASALFTIFCFGAAFGTLWLCGVRDWRLYGLTLIWPPVISGWQTANVSLPLALGIAVAWRYRDRPAVAGVLVGLMASVKLFLWPLGLWLLLSRRWRALGWGVVTALVVNAISWAVLGFNQLGPYMRLVNAVTKSEERAAYTPLAFALHVGASRTVADAVAGFFICLALAVCVYSARRGREAALLLGTITLSLLATPVVWVHYFVLLLVPLAIMRPRLSPAWLLPLLLVACPVTAPALWQRALALAVIGVVIASLLGWRLPRPRRRAAIAAPESGRGVP